MKKTLDHYIDILRREKRKKSASYQIKSLGIFGSFAKGEACKKSDVDILVEFKKPISFFQFIRLEKHLSNKIGRKVDLVSKPALKKSLRKNILSTTIYAE